MALNKRPFSAVNNNDGTTEASDTTSDASSLRSSSSSQPASKKPCLPDGRHNTGDQQEMGRSVSAAADCCDNQSQ